MNEPQKGDYGIRIDRDGKFEWIVNGVVYRLRQHALEKVAPRGDETYSDPHPDWSQCSLWMTCVGEETRAIWASFTPEQRIAIGRDAQSAAYDAAELGARSEG